MFWSSIQTSLLLQLFLFQCLKHFQFAPSPCLSLSQTPCLTFLQLCTPTPLTCSSVMDMISCQVSSISPSSRVGSCVTLFLLCWGGHGGILLDQGLVQGPPKLK